MLAKRKGVTGGRRNGGEMRVGGGGWVEKGEAETEGEKGEGEHMWKSLQCGSRHSRSSRRVLPGRAGSYRLSKLSGCGKERRYV